MRGMKKLWCGCRICILRRVSQSSAPSRGRSVPRPPAGSRAEPPRAHTRMRVPPQHVHHRRHKLLFDQSRSTVARCLICQVKNLNFLIFGPEPASGRRGAGRSRVQLARGQAKASSRVPTSSGRYKLPFRVISDPHAAAVRALVSLSKSSQKWQRRKPRGGHRSECTRAGQAVSARIHAAPSRRRCRASNRRAGSVDIPPHPTPNTRTSCSRCQTALAQWLG